MYVISFRSTVLILFVLLLTLACSAGEISQQFLVTLTPTPGKDILPTMTTLPTVVYPTLEVIPSSTPIELPSMTCTPETVSVICEATVCVVRKTPEGGKDNIAYTVPNKAVLEGATKCICYSCASFEQDWFFWMDRDGNQFWAIHMDQVWEEIKGEK